MHKDRNVSDTFDGKSREISGKAIARRACNADCHTVHSFRSNACLIEPAMHALSADVSTGRLVLSSYEYQRDRWCICNNIAYYAIFRTIFVLRFAKNQRTRVYILVFITCCAGNCSFSFLSTWHSGRSLSAAGGTSDR
jgi:hypothetical protein